MSFLKNSSNDEDSLNENQIVASNSQETQKIRDNIALYQHGPMYQIKLLLWYLVNGVSKHYNSFRLSTELKQAKKFDDIIYEYVENGKKVYGLVQTKHLRHQNKKLQLNDDLLTLQTHRNFSLLKYFISYQELKNEEMFQKGEIKDLVIFTNIDFDLETEVTVYGSEKVAIRDIVTKLENEDDLLGFTETELERIPARYRFNDKMILVFFQKILELELQAKNNKNKKEKGLNLTEEFGIDKDKSFENNTKFYELIKEFFDHLVFAVNQPNVDELDAIIISYINDNFDVLPNNAYQDILFEMQNWVGGKGNEFLSFQDLNKWFETLKNDLDETTIQRHPTFEFESQIKIKKVFFKSDIVQQNSALANFLSPENTIHQLFHFVSDETKFTCIKVFQVLQNTKFKNNYYFFQLKYILENKNDFIAVLQKNNFLLIIEYLNEGNPTKIKDLALNMLKIIEESSKMKIILITKPDDKFGEIFKDKIDIKYKREVDPNPKLKDLEDESQEQFLKKTVLFQGKEVNLGKLINKFDLENFIDLCTLAKLMKNDKIEIGKPLMGLLDVENYFIDRTFKREVGIKKDIKEKPGFVFIYSYDDITSENFSTNQDIVITSNDKNQFEKLCKNYAEYNIHWIKRDSRVLIWQKTHNSLSKIREFIYDTESNSKTRIEDFEEKIIIITGEPGIGKSTIMTEIGKKLKETDHNSWIVRINFLDHVEQFSYWEENFKKIKIEHALEFLFQNMLLQEFNEHLSIKFNEMNNKINMIKGADSLEVNLLIHYYNNRKLIFLFDGFDEIAPDFEENVSEILKILKKCKLRFWVTSRNYDILKELENKLGEFTYILKTFSEEDQKNFLKKYWSYKLRLIELDTKRFNYFFYSLLENIKKNIYEAEKNFLSIPLHIRMIAEYFQEIFESYYNSNCQELSDDYKKMLNEKTNLCNLYQSFIKKKFYDILNKEKRPWQKPNDPWYKKYLKKKKNELLVNYTKLALFSMFEKETLENLFPDENMKNISNLVEQIKEGGENVGIIVKIVNEKPFFVHITFAEYFIANYIWIKFKSISRQAIKDFIENVIITNIIIRQRIQIFNFLQSIASEDLKNNIEFNDKNFKINKLFCMLIKCDTLITHRFEKITEAELLLNIVESALETCENNHQEILHNIEEFEIKIRIKLLNVSSKFGYKNIVTYLKYSFNTNDLECLLKVKDWEENPLYLAVKKDHVNVAEILIKEYNIKPTCLDKDKNDLFGCILKKKWKINDHSAIEHCLTLKILDYNTLITIRGTEKPLLIGCIGAGCADHFIKLLIEKVDINIIKKVEEFDLEFCKNLLFEYDIEVIRLLVDKGLDFNMVFEYFPSIQYNLLYFAYDSLNTKRRAMENVEFLLEKNVILPLQLLKYILRPYFITKLLAELKILHDKTHDNYTLAQKLLKLIIDFTDQKPEYKLQFESDKEYLWFCGRNGREYKIGEFNRMIKYGEFEPKLRENGEVSAKDASYYFDLEDLNLNEELQSLIEDIYNCDGIEDLVDFRNEYINEVDRIQKLDLDKIVKSKDDFEKMIDLYNNVHKNFSALMQTIEAKNDEELDDVLYNMEWIFLNSIINGKDFVYGSPLHFAVSTGNLKAVKILLRYGANENIRLEEYNSYLFNGIRPPNKDFKKYFRGYLPLHIAALGDNKDMFTFLYQNRIEKNFKDSFGQTPLHYVAICGNFEMMDYITRETVFNNSIEDDYGKMFEDYI